jgi:type I restriction enzyme M protein
MNSEAKRRIDAARQILVGKIPDPKGQVQEITNALVYKFMDDMDEMTASIGGKRRYFTGEYEKYSWRTIMSPKMGAHERIDLYTQALRNLSINKNLPELFRGIFRNAYLPFNDGRTLTLFLKEIDYFNYKNSEDLGNAYEYLLSIMGSQGDAGQFRTPRHIIDFIVEVIHPTKDDSVLDPACGTAGFLISAYKHVMRQHDGKDDGGNPKPEEISLNADEKKMLHQNYRGFDIDDNMVKIAQVNMYLHSFPNPNILVHDTLSSEDYWQDRYDVILANPPFMTPKGGSMPHNKFGIQSTRSEVLFVDYIMSHLKPHGRAGIIVPEGIIFQSGKAHQQLRENLVKDGLYAVVSLPSGVFNPYAGVKTSILLFDNQIAQRSDSILFVKIEADGFDLGAQRRKIDRNDLPGAISEIRAYQEFINTGKVTTLFTERVQKEHTNDSIAILHDKFLLVKKTRIAENGDYNLSGDRYKPSNLNTNTIWPMVELEKIVDYEQPTKYIVESVDYDNNYKTPVLTAGKSFILGYTNEVTGVYSNPLPVIIFDDFTTAIKYVDFPFKVKSSAMKLLHVKRDVALPKYVFMAMKGISFIPGEHKRYWISQYSKFKIPLPPLEIQEQIVAELDSYQKIINGARQIAANWRPKIDIDLEWKKVKLGEVCSFEYGGAMPEKNRVAGNYPVVGSNGVVGTHNDYIVDGPAIVVGRKGSAGEVNWIEENCFPIDTTYYVKIKNKKELDLKYLFFVLLDLDLQSLRGGGAVPGLNRNDAYEKVLLLPPLEIQKQIVDKIEAEQALVDSAKKLIEIYEQKTKDRIAQLWEGEGNGK